MDGYLHDIKEPWLEEPDSIIWIDKTTGYKCFVRRNFSLGTLCGYVRIPKNNTLYKKNHRLPDNDYRYRNNPLGRNRRSLDLKIEVHGGITFSGKPVRVLGGRLRGHWFGFDCAHSNDLIPEVLSGLSTEGLLMYAKDCIYRDLNYVKDQCALLAQQLQLT